MGLFGFPGWVVPGILVLLAASAGRGACHRPQFEDLPLEAAPAGSAICAAAVVVHGYKCQEFEVKTEDGYILSLQRIPEGRSGNGGSGDKQKPPVLIQHGILSDGMTWFLNSPDKNLPFILAENGFDVWIANARGTNQSRRHVSLSSSDPEYWNWSWEELAAYDLPANLDFVFSQTGQKSHYVGHSLGTLVALVALSEGKLLDRMRSAALLSPIAYLSHMSSPLLVLAAKSFVGEITEIFGHAEFNLRRQDATDFLKSLCVNNGIDCFDLLITLTGMNCCLNSSTVDLLLTYEPQATSTKNLIHLSQIYRHKVVAKYDYVNILSNIEHYGRPRPPAYDLSNIPVDFPLFLSYGGRDTLSDVLDVQHLLDDLKSHDEDKYSVQFIENYAHVDFIMGISAKDIVYNPIISFFNRN
ncbi:triacylglycerol lipase 2-like [Malania oleifera]|uniref:triacylglycerol lipase 2-like n=1 Tax=Malania oleifera TaxID=397392 RepID=UPI0025ADA0C5|nr:triacylglycerol lipase 2-like [Malania oleifera]